MTEESLYLRILPSFIPLKVNYPFWDTLYITQTSESKTELLTIVYLSENFYVRVKKRLYFDSLRNEGYKRAYNDNPL